MSIQIFRHEQYIHIFAHHFPNCANFLPSHPMGLFFHQHPNPPPKKKKLRKRKTRRRTGRTTEATRPKLTTTSVGFFGIMEISRRSVTENENLEKKRTMGMERVMCSQKSVKKKQREEKTLLFNSVDFFFRWHQMVWLVCLFTRALSFLEKVVSCGSSSLFQTKKTEVVVKAPCLGYV